MALAWQLHAKILPATLVVREPRRLTYRLQRSGGRGTEEKEREKREREEKGEKGVVVEQKEEERGILDR